MIVGLYIRVSTQEQATEGYSLEFQEERLRDYCKAKGWKVSKVYTDAGFSGANQKRPALQQLIKDVKNKKMELVLVYKLDRLSRSQKDTLELIEDVFLKHKVEFVSMNENFDTSSPFGRAMIGMLSVFAQLEREQIKERLNSGRLTRAKNGLYHGGGWAPIGYDYVNGELVINEYEAMQIREMFDLFLKGYSMQRILNVLNKKYTYKYGKWERRVTIQHCLTNPLYYGKVTFDKQIFEGKHDPIITEEIFNKAQERFKEIEKKNPNSKTSYKPNNILTGVLWCGYCGARCHGHSMGIAPKPIYHYYKCYSKSKASKTMIRDENCISKSWKRDVLDKLVIDEILKLQFDENYINELIGKNENSDFNKNNIETLKSKIEDLDDQINKIMDMYQLGTLSMDKLQKRIEKINEEHERLTEQLNILENEEKETLSLSEIKETIKNADIILKGDDMDDKRMLVHSLINNIIVYNDHIDIHWNF